MSDTSVNPLYRDEHGARIICADSHNYLKTLPDNSVDSIVTDPPYEIGFMGRGWDSTGIAYSVELWKECLRVLKPGGHALVFGATRTYHRVAVAIEDAGFEIRDSIHWVYGQGFPKSMDISKALNKQAGAERKVIGKHLNPAGSKGNTFPFGQEVNITAPTTDAAKQWSGWGTALKPAHEPIVVARKPLAGTVAANVLEWGVGGLNIDASRVGTDPIVINGQGNDNFFHGKFSGKIDNPNRVGRFPSNFLLTHSPDCVDTGETTSDTFGGGAKGSSGFAAGYEGDGFVGQDQETPVFHCAPGCPVAEIDQQSGYSKSATAGRHKREGTTPKYGTPGGYLPSKTVVTDSIEHGDAGGASRFFPAFQYEGKASTKERPIHPETGKGHPTVKPLELMRWLVRLVTPVGGTVLEPFAGSGATVEAALLEGMKVIAIDITPEHMPLIDARIDRWAAGLSPVKKKPTAKKTAKAQNKPVAATGGRMTALDAADAALAALSRSKPSTGRTADDAVTLFDLDEPTV